MNLAVVITHWGPAIPRRRLADHWDWNDASYRAHCAQAYVVADSPREVPDYATVVLCREDLQPFSLSRTSNIGIRAALADGADVIVKADPDILWPSSTLGLCACLGDGRGIAPVYRMAASRFAAETCAASCPAWSESHGTLCLHADTWREINGYDERMSGYGVEDGDAALRARRHIKLDRSPIVYHIAHSEGAGQCQGRGDHWGRDGVNPLHRRENMSLFNGSRSGRDPWTNEAWGLASSPHARPQRAEGESE